MTGRTIKALPITAERFAPFGDVIVAGQAPMTTIDEARFQQFANLANVDIDPAGAVSIGIVRSKSPTSFPYHFDMVERHPLGSQAFIPLTEFVFVVVVARPAEFVRVEDLHAFITNGKQGVNYHRGAWHMPLIAMAEGQEFLVIDRSPTQDNCEELILERPAVLEL